MKIAYLANVRIPSERAHSVQIVHMCQAFANNGVEVVLYVNKREQSSLTEIADFYQIKTHFQISRLGHGFLVPGWHWTYYFSELYFAGAFLWQRKYAYYDKVYARNEWIVWFLSLFIPSSKLVWESHQGSLSFPARSILKQRIKIVAISTGIKKLYKNKYPQNEILVADDGIDESFYADLPNQDTVRNKLNLPLDKKIILYIGGLDQWKGVDTFLEASELAPEMLFLVIGGSEEEIVMYRERYPRVHFLGFRPYRELKDNQQLADVIVIPNTGKNLLSAEYTSPLKLFSALTSRIPLLVSDIPSLRSIVDEKSAYLYTPDQPVALVEAVRRALSEPLKAKEKALIAYELSKQYTWTKRAEKIKDFMN